VSPLCRAANDAARARACSLCSATVGRCDAVGLVSCSSSGRPLLHRPVTDKLPHWDVQVYVKDLRATTDRDSLLDLFDRARQVGFNVDRLQIINMHLHIRASVASTGRVPAGGLNEPAIGLAYLEMREVRSDMTPAQAAASMVSLREQTRMSGSEAEVVSMAVRVEQRLSRTQARLRTMDVRQAALRVVRQLEVRLLTSRNSRFSLKSPSLITHGCFMSSVIGTQAHINTNAVASTRDMLKSQGRFALQRGSWGA
jgi:hypothetical protein